MRLSIIETTRKDKKNQLATTNVYIQNPILKKNHEEVKIASIKIKQISLHYTRKNTWEESLMSLSKTLTKTIKKELKSAFFIL